MQNFNHRGHAYGSNGIIWKNNINARGSDGRLLPLDQKRCTVCRERIDDFETALYGFLARGTQSANGAFCHVKCEKELHIVPMDNNRTCCRICGGSKELDGKFRLNYGRHIWYHQKCLDKAPRGEVVSKEAIEKSLKSRLTRRLKQAGIWFKHPEERLGILVMHGPHWVPLVEAIRSKSEEWLSIYQKVTQEYTRKVVTR